ncbi:hypothetical protein MBBTH_21680 [Methanobrevibacter thaueri]|uniref:Uncharacterized protein n=1 Tax=Methanobrevibacter thaueri TaxID=190975 RepID=A0A315XK83_9EURY|nr:hypothetical protein MBBTH_21680 [Methanobrevibacter thaueri]
MVKVVRYISVEISHHLTMSHPEITLLLMVVQHPFMVKMLKFKIPSLQIMKPTLVELSMFQVMKDTSQIITFYPILQVLVVEFLLPEMIVNFHKTIYPTMMLTSVEESPYLDPIHYLTTIILHIIMPTL